MIKKQEILSIVENFKFNESKKLAFSTYTHEIFAFSSVIPLIQYGLNSKINVFVYITFGVLFIIFLFSFICKLKYLNKFKLLDRFIFTIEVLFYLLFYITTILYTYYCVRNEINNDNKSIISTYEYVFLLPIIIFIYILGVVLYNHLYYSRINFKHFRKLYDSKRIKELNNKEIKLDE